MLRIGTAWSIIRRRLGKSVALPTKLPNCLTIASTRTADYAAPRWQPVMQRYRAKRSLTYRCRVRVPVGSTVIVVLREDDEPFELIPEEEDKRLESIAVIER